MKRRSESRVAGLLAILALMTLFSGCLSTVGMGEISVDSMTAASGKYHYEAASYNRETLQGILAAYPYPAATAVSTVNVDGSPNLAIGIPGLSKEGEYLFLALADNRTKDNILRDGRALILFYEYKPRAAKEERNKGCRVVVRWVGLPENERLNTLEGREYPGLYLEIVKILPLG